MSDQLAGLLRRFEELDGRLTSLLGRKDFAATAAIIREGAHCSYRIRWLLASKAAVVSKDPKLRMFRDERFQLQGVIRDLGLTDTWPFETEEPDGGWLADPHLSQLLDPEDPDHLERIVDRLLSAAVLIVQHDLPDWVLTHLQTVRRCFALSLLDAAWLFLRALVETASFEWLTQQGILSREGTVRSMAERRLAESIRLVAAHAAMPRAELERVWTVIDGANRLIHAKKKVPPPTDRKTLEALEIVIAYVERLFG